MSMTPVANEILLVLAATYVKTVTDSLANLANKAQTEQKLYEQSLSSNVYNLFL